LNRLRMRVPSIHEVATREQNAGGAGGGSAQKISPTVHVLPSQLVDSCD